MTDKEEKEYRYHTARIDWEKDQISKIEEEEEEQWQREQREKPLGKWGQLAIDICYGAYNINRE